MPQFRSGSIGHTRIGGISPLTGARAGTVNDAGGLQTGINIAASPAKSYTLQVETGVVGTSVDCKIQDATVVGGPYADVPNGAITQVAAGAGPVARSVDVKPQPGRNFWQIVMVAVGATSAASATLFANNPMATNRT